MKPTSDNSLSKRKKIKGYRSLAREKVLQVLTAYVVSGEGWKELFNLIFFREYNFENGNIKIDKLLTREEIQELEADIPIEWDAEEIEFAKKLFSSTLQSIEFSNEMIKKMVENWEFERIALLDRLILEMAIAELLHFPEIPPKVTINEAIEIAKEYSTDKSGQFVNGLLDKILKELTYQGIIKKDLPYDLESQKEKKQLIVISAPSGAGKTTLARYLLTKYPNFKFSISATTRKPRLNEINGKDYFFFTKEEFQNLIREGKLIEYEEIFGNYYGTLKTQVENALLKGEVVIFDIDVKGALSIRKEYPMQSLLIFIAPPSIEILVERLKNRGTEDNEQLQKRIERAKMEMQQINKFDYVIINDDLEKARIELDLIIKKGIPNL